MTTELNLNMDLDSLLDGTLDDLADMPEWKPLPAGAHRAVIAAWEQKSLDDKSAKGPDGTAKKNTMMIMKVKVLETVEPAVAGEVANPEQAVEFSFFLVHHSSVPAVEVGQGTFKKIMQAIAENYGADTPRNLMEKSVGTEVLLITTLRKRKDDPEKFNVNLDSIKVI